MYQKVSTNLNFVDREKETEKFWRENDIFQKSMKAREGCPTYTFYDGPPTANVSLPRTIRTIHCKKGTTWIFH